VEFDTGVPRTPLVQTAADTDFALQKARTVSSMALRTLVVGDECLGRNYLIELIQSSGLADVVGAVATADAARQAVLAEGADRGRADVAFVDVSLKADSSRESGLSLVRSLLGHPGAPMLVVTTADDKHALEAFELGVVDYLLKPFNEERVAHCLCRLHERRSAGRRLPNSSVRIVARRNRNMVFLKPQEVWAFEASDRLTFVHAAYGKFDLDLSLAVFEASFGRTFTRVHRSWLVNFAHVRELERDEHQTKLFVGSTIAAQGLGLRVPVARERAGFVREMLLMNATGVRTADSRSRGIR
jgi:DNA-binding LytR/AlgR family response regulator